MVCYTLKVQSKNYKYNQIKIYLEYSYTIVKQLHFNKNKLKKILLSPECYFCQQQFLTVFGSKISLKLYKEGLPSLHGGPVVKNLPCNTRDTGLIPGQETEVPHVAGQLRSPAATTEPKRSRAHALQLERPHAATKDPA